MKRIIKSLLLMALATLIFSTMTACGEESKTKALFEGIDKDSGIHMKFSMDYQDVTVPADVYVKGENAKVSTAVQNQAVTMILRDGKVSILDDTKKTYVTVSLTEDIKEQMKSLQDTPTKMRDFSEGDDFETGTRKIDGMEYYTEIFKNGDDEAEFAFNDDDELAYIFAKQDGTETQLKVEVLEGDVQKSDFDIPNDYTQSQENTADTSGNGNDTSGSGVASGVQKTGGGNQIITSNEGKFTFSTDEDYIVELNGEYCDVYLEKKSTIPSFNLYAMVQVNNQTVDDFLNGVIESVKKQQKNKLTQQPQKQTINVNGRKVQGIKYSYSTDDGKSTVVAENFAEIYNGTIYSWGSAYMKGDNVTPGVVQGAMQNFRVL